MSFICLLIGRFLSQVVQSHSGRSSIMSSNYGRTGKS
ncbi:hypothetical protein Gogos_015983 [Gossypium gossypioides]|uniref:Uncharacterized protein n=1 Tax=Gossypium gossypioides TaxID=34282 RepID=A0A7J9B6E3_GOSGO|nr:hypothetical protein [Gossypium gossypioides]